MKIPTWCRSLACLTAVALFPLSALAVQENTVVALPSTAPDKSFPLPTENPYAIERMSGYYGPSGLNPEPNYQYPSFSATEKERIPKLLADYQAGARPTQSVLNVTENVVVGVYSLRPEDYEGETVYALLPARELTDDELLAVIDAYAQLGQTLDPEGLSQRNCARGGGIEASRFYTEEERERRTQLIDLFKRQGIRAQGEATRIPGDDGVGIVTTNVEEYCGLDAFRFLPYREQTDEELLRNIALQEPAAEATLDVAAMNAYEGETRSQLVRVLGLPPSLTRIDDSLAKASDFDTALSDTPVYQCSLSNETPDGMVLSVWSLLDRDTHKLVTAHYFRYAKADGPYSDVLGDPYDPRWQTLAREAVQRMRGDDAKILDVLPTAECSAINSLGTVVQMQVLLEDGSVYNLRFHYTDDFLEFAEYHAQAPKPIDATGK